MTSDVIIPAGWKRINPGTPRRPGVDRYLSIVCDQMTWHTCRQSGPVPPDTCYIRPTTPAKKRRSKYEPKPRETAGGSATIDLSINTVFHTPPLAVNAGCLIIAAVEDEMVTVHTVIRPDATTFYKTVFMSCPEQAHDFRRDFKTREFKTPQELEDAVSTFKQNWQSKHPEEI